VGEGRAEHLNKWAGAISRRNVPGDGEGIREAKRKARGKE